MMALWLFLYVAWLVRNLGLLGLEERSWSTLLLLLPLLILPATARVRRLRPELFHGWPTRIAGLLALVASLILARLLSLDFWDTRQVAASALLAVMGLGLQWVMLARPEKTGGVRLWLWIAFWEYAGAWHPALTLLGAGLGAFLAAYQFLPRQPEPLSARVPVQAWPAMFLLGLTLPKPAWDFLLEPAWARAFAAFALGVALTHAGRLRTWGERLPSGVLFGAIGALFALYVSALVSVWALALGLAAGWIWPRLPRPLPAVKLTAAFLVGLLLSFVLHANAGRPLLRHLIWPGGGLSRSLPL